MVCTETVTKVGKLGDKIEDTHAELVSHLRVEQAETNGYLKTIVQRK